MRIWFWKKWMDIKWNIIPSTLRQWKAINPVPFRKFLVKRVRLAPNSIQTAKGTATPFLRLNITAPETGERDPSSLCFKAKSRGSHHERLAAPAFLLLRPAFFVRPVKCHLNRMSGQFTHCTFACASQVFAVCGHLFRRTRRHMGYNRRFPYILLPQYPRPLCLILWSLWIVLFVVKHFTEPCIWKFSKYYLEGLRSIPLHLCSRLTFILNFRTLL